MDFLELVRALRTDFSSEGRAICLPPAEILYLAQYPFAALPCQRVFVKQPPITNIDAMGWKPRFYDP